MVSTDTEVKTKTGLMFGQTSSAGSNLETKGKGCLEAKVGSDVSSAPVTVRMTMEVGGTPVVLEGTPTTILEVMRSLGK